MKTKTTRVYEFSDCGGSRSRVACFSIKTGSDEAMGRFIAELEKTEGRSGNTHYGEEDGEIWWTVEWEAGEQKKVFAAFKKAVKAAAAAA